MTLPPHLPPPSPASGRGGAAATQRQASQNAGATSSAGRVTPKAEPAALATARRLLRNRKGLIGTSFLLALVLIGAIGPYVVTNDPNALHGADQLKPPSATYWFGTDELGRDILSR